MRIGCCANICEGLMKIFQDSFYLSGLSARGVTVMSWSRLGLVIMLRLARNAKDLGLCLRYSTLPYIATIPMTRYNM